jgi:hemerythrin-like domain-containing protein
VRSTDDLRHEHRVILVVLTGMEGMASGLEQGRSLRRDEAEKVIEILRVFVDKCHHGKEERHLFKALEAHGMSRGSGPLALMMKEHEEGRAHVRVLVQAMPGAVEGSSQARSDYAEHTRAYVILLRAHIKKENGVIFPMAERMLSEEDDAKLSEAFEAIEHDEIGEGAHEKYREWAQELASRGQ